LERIDAEWEELEIVIVAHKKDSADGPFWKMAAPKPIQDALEKHMMELSTFKTSIFAKAYSARIELWDSDLNKMYDTLENL
jgi:hypothetical protein